MILAHHSHSGAQQWHIQFLKGIAATLFVFRSPTLFVFRRPTDIRPSISERNTKDAGAED